MNTLFESNRPAEILLVEDNENDVILTREGFNSINVKVNLHHVQNGKECLEFLRKKGRFTDVPVPDVILLDLNMPIMGGREVLAELSADESLNHLPVVVLTTSTDEGDVLTMYNLQCSSFIVKPMEFDDFLEVIKKFSDYWFSLVLLPPHENTAALQKRG